MNKNKIIRNIFYLVKRLFNSLSAFFSELFKPVAFLKGDDFERCLRKNVYKKDEYELVMKTHGFHENKKDYVESSLFPDYLFRNRKTQEEFFVEAKYRENLYKGKVKWCNHYQFRRYKQLNKETPVIIAIGLGGRPANPKNIFLVPLDQIEYYTLTPGYLENYHFEGKRKNVLDRFADKIYDLFKE